MSLLLRLVASAVALWVASVLVEGVDVTTSTTQDKVLTLLAVAVVFGLVNAVIKPVVTFLAFPFYVLTLGLLTFVVNGLLLWLTGTLSSDLGLEFAVDGFWPGVWGALVVTIVSFAISLVLPDRD